MDVYAGVHICTDFWIERKENCLCSHSVVLFVAHSVHEKMEYSHEVVMKVRKNFFYIKFYFSKLYGSSSSSFIFHSFLILLLLLLNFVMEEKLKLIFITKLMFHKRYLLFCMLVYAASFFAYVLSHHQRLSTWVFSSRIENFFNLMLLKLACLNALMLLGAFAGNKMNEGQLR